MRRRELFVLTLLLYLVVLVVGWLHAPERVPVHFDGSGRADRFGGRAQAGLVFAAVGAATALVLGLLAGFADRLPNGLFKVPNKAWWTATPERERELRTRLQADFYVIGSLTMLLLSELVGEAYRSAHRDPPRLDASANVVLVVFLLLLGAQIVHMAVRRYAKDET